VKNLNFIEVYDNALPDDVCDYLISIFNRENMMMRDKNVHETTSYWGDKPNLVSALEMMLHSENYNYKEIIEDLDYVLKTKVFDYNNKYQIWSHQQNANLLTDDERKKLIDIDTPEMLNHYIHRFGEWAIKKFRYPNDGYHGWHGDWTKNPYFIQRVLASQFYLNDVEEGGETEFLHQQIKVKPKKGRLVIWPVGFTHTHRGNKPISNDKYTVATWLTTIR